MDTSFDLAIVGPALLAGILVLSTHVPLGRKVLDRGIIFIDLAIAQVAAVGVIIADNMGLDHAWEVQVKVTHPQLPQGFLLSVRLTKYHEKK